MAYHERRHENKVAVVTGASRGIGRAIALRLAGEGAKVMLGARDAGALAEVAGEITKSGGTAKVFATDLREADAPGRLVAAAEDAFGGIDLLVNNAGATKRGDFLHLTDGDFQDGFALKYYGAVRATRAAWGSLRSRHGTVINVVGVGGRTPGAEFAVGGSVNAALLSLTKALAEKGVDDGIQVVAVNPGPVRTDRFTARFRGEADAAAAERNFVAEVGITRVGEPEDVAALVAFLASEEGRLIHGALIDIDGGQTRTI
ncbi:MAG TPA: SDR family oxidoreductase [Chthoniobacterales bacterium]